MRFPLILCLLAGFSTSLRAQTSPELSASEIKLGLNKLNVLGSVLYVGAHPDDENTRLLAWLAKEKLYRTAYLSLTRGDGGQNLIGSEQAEQLGLIRTQELLAARRIDGAEQFFSRANDFGFSKTSEETLRIWDHDRILSDVVWTIRKFRPDIIITRFTNDARAGHGHHQTSSILAQEAFDAAADPKRFPEQLKEVSVWQARCILLNGFGGVTAGDKQLRLDIGTYNPLLGRSFGEIAADSRSSHKSQGFGSGRQRGSTIETFSLWKGAMPENELMDGVKTDWSRIKNGEKAGALASRLTRAFDLEHPDRSVSDLLDLLTEVEKLDDPYWKTLKSKEIKDLILACAGVWFESYAGAASYALGDDIPVTAQLINRSALPVALVAAPGTVNTNQRIALETNKPVSVSSIVRAAATTQPYYLAEDHPIGEYVVDKLPWIGWPENPDGLSQEFRISIGGRELIYVRPVVFKYTDQVRGEIYSNLTVVPPVTLTLQKKVLLFTTNQPQDLVITLKIHQANTSGTLSLKLPKGWKAEPATVAFTGVTKGEEQLVAFKISGSTSAETGMITPVARIGEANYSLDISTITYEHIPAITWFPKAEARVARINLNYSGRNIAYIPGAGDLVADMLKQVGYTVTILNSEQIALTNLAAFDAIIAGVRAYNTVAQLKSVQAKLLEYVKNGGTYLVQYNVNQPLVVSNIGPYPFSLSRDRVTEENAAVIFTNPADPVLNVPNKITAADFDGWIQERGLYFATAADPQYRLPLSMNDIGERPLTGSLLVADYGKGKFVYTSLVFFRALPAGVPGAYRLFVNLIAKRP